MVAEHLVAQLAELDEEARALPRRLRVALLLIEVARRLVVVGRVDRDLPQRRQRRQVRRIEIERHLVALLRRDAVAELLVERLADPVERLDALLGVLRQLGDARHVLDGLRRVVQLVVELRERLERRDVLVVEVDDVLVRVDRALGVLDLVGVDLRDRPEEIDLRLAIERRRDVAVVGVDEVEPLAQLAVAALELEVRLFVVGVDLEHLLEPLGREVGLEEVLLVERREVHEHLDLLALGRHDVELTLEHRHELGPLLERLVDARRDRGGPRGSCGVGLDDLAVDLRGPRGLAQARLVELRDAQLGGDDLGRLVERRHLALEDRRRARGSGLRAA